MLLKGLECQASALVHSDACPRPTTSHLPPPRGVTRGFGLETCRGAWARVTTARLRRGPLRTASTHTMRLEFSGPFLNGLDGERQSFPGERSR